MYFVLYMSNNEYFIVYTYDRLMAFSQIRNLDILFFLCTGDISQIIIFGWHTYVGCTISAYRTDPCLYHVPEALAKEWVVDARTLLCKI